MEGPAGEHLTHLPVAKKESLFEKVSSFPSFKRHAPETQSKQGVRK